MAKRRSAGPDLGKVLIDIVKAVFGSLAKSNRQGNTARRTAPRQQKPPEGDFDLEVVGEASYRQNLRSLFGADEGRRYFQAELCPEPDNPHDPNAVKVLIDGKTVGYLSRRMAQVYKRRYGLQVTFVATVIVAREGGYGVWLDCNL